MKNCSYPRTHFCHQILLHPILGHRQCALWKMKNQGSQSIQASSSSKSSSFTNKFRSCDQFFVWRFNIFSCVPTIHKELHMKKSRSLMYVSANMWNTLASLVNFIWLQLKLTKPHAKNWPSWAPSPGTAASKVHVPVHNPPSIPETC